MVAFSRRVWGLIWGPRLVIREISRFSGFIFASSADSTSDTRRCVLKFKVRFEAGAGRDSGPLPTVRKIRHLRTVGGERSGIVQ